MTLHDAARERSGKSPEQQILKPSALIPLVIKAIGNNEERKRNHSTETQDFNVVNRFRVIFNSLDRLAREG
jgi:hypothetical protein